jgi:hypothetical protein
MYWNLEIYWPADKEPVKWVLTPQVCFINGETNWFDIEKMEPVLSMAVCCQTRFVVRH